MKFKNVMILVMAVLILVILLQNTGMITFKFLFWQITLSQFFYIPLWVGLGFFLGYFTAVMRVRPKKRTHASEAEKPAE